MTPFTIVSGPAIVLPLDNIDTDQLIPARFMKRSRSEGYGDYLLYDMRFDEKGQRRQDEILSHMPASATVLVAGENFGCGSSRESAVYALMDYGIRVVVAKTFADIFRNNAANNGLLTITLSAEDHDALNRYLVSKPDTEIAVNLELQYLAMDEAGTFQFDIDPVVKRRLLLGLDALTETLTEHQALFDFEESYFRNNPWVIPAKISLSSGSSE